MPENKTKKILYRNAIPPTEEDILQYMQEVCTIYKIDYDNLANEPTQRYNFVIRKIGDHFFKNTDILQIESNYKNEYNNIVIEKYLYIYLSICGLFNKIPMLLTFCDFIGVRYDTMLNPARSEIIKLLNLERESGLVNSLEDGKKNPVGVVAILNKTYGWNKETQRTADDRKSLSVNDLKDILAITQKENN